MADEDIILCGVVVEKRGEMERFCTEKAGYVVAIMADDNTKPVDGIALCERHSDRFDDGHSLMCMSRKGNMILIGLNPEDDEGTMEVDDSSPPVVREDAPAPN